MRSRFHITLNYGHEKSTRTAQNAQQYLRALLRKLASTALAMSAVAANATGARMTGGVIAWSREANPAIGAYGEPTILYQHGEVPDME
ncbi:hypothetical protein ACHMW7_08835 [Aminobacter sp. UC22_36]